MCGYHIMVIIGRLIHCKIVIFLEKNLTFGTKKIQDANKDYVKTKKSYCNRSLLEISPFI